jgi:hypothetical protein
VRGLVHVVQASGVSTLANEDRLEVEAVVHLAGVEPVNHLCAEEIIVSDTRRSVAVASSTPNRTTGRGLARRLAGYEELNPTERSDAWPRERPASTM